MLKNSKKGKISKAYIKKTWDYTHTHTNKHIIFRLKKSIYIDWKLE
jgi:hypothetical protein